MATEGEEVATTKELKAKRESFRQDIDMPYVVYKERFLILAALTLNYFMWNWAGSRHQIIAPSYALFYNTTNNLDLGSGELGVDSLTLIPALVLVFSYIPCSYAIDRFGIRWMKLGSAVITLHIWLWYLNDIGAFGTPTVIPVVIASVFSSIFGPLVSTSLLAVSNRWFAVKERAKATATVALVSTLGTAFVVLVGPSFEIEDDKINLNLKSCKPSLETIQKYNEFLVNGSEPFCDRTNNEAPEYLDFCCVAKANVETYGLILAILCTLVTIFTFIVVTDKPPTPPSEANETLDYLPNFMVAVRHMIKFPNYLTLCLADFTISGPPIVLSAAIARMLPPVIQDYDFILAALGIVLAIPVAAVFAAYLDRKHYYWELTTGGYTFGAVSWVIATICFAAGGAGAYIMAPVIVLSIVAFIAWQAAVYETKLEYVFSTEFQIEGLVVGMDRLLINLATVIFLPVLAPENLGNNPLNTYAIGCGLVILGAIMPYTIKKKRAYNRLSRDNQAKNILEPVNDL